MIDLHRYVLAGYAFYLRGTACLWLDTGHGFDGADAASKQTGLIVLGLSFFKVRLVIRHFMEVAHAPIALKLVADGWLLIVCGVAVGMYLRF